jgi:hypothetical protein
MRERLSSGDEMKKRYETIWDVRGVLKKKKSLDATAFKRKIGISRAARNKKSLDTKS